MAKRVYNFNQFLLESQNAQAAILSATNRKLWADVFKSNYLTETEKSWFANFLAEQNIEADIYNLNESVWDAIKKGVEDLKDSTIGKAIVDKIGKAMDGAKNFAAYVGDLLKKAWDKLISFFKNKFKSFKDVIKKDYEKLKSGGKDVSTNIKDELKSLKDTTEYWTVEVPSSIVKAITGKFSQEIVKECLSFNGNIINELSTFDPKQMDVLLMEAADEEETGDVKKGSFSFLNTMAHAIAKFPPFTLLTKVKELGTAGAKAILKKFSEITKSLGGPGVYDFVVISLIAGGALELYLKHKAAHFLDAGLDEVISAEPVLKMIPMAKTIIHTIELVALFLLVVETVGELAADEEKAAH